MTTPPPTATSSFRRVLVCGVTLACLLSVARAESNPQSQNVLFIAIDDLNDWVGCLGGHPNAKTPNIDRLAGRGVLFTNAHCVSPSCNPSRTAMLTGVRPSTSGVYRNSQDWRKSPALKDIVTLPRCFMNHGYHVMGSGKIFHGRYPSHDSWHEYWPSKNRPRPGNPPPPASYVARGPRLGNSRIDWVGLDAPKEEMSDWKVADWIGKQLETEQGKPFFLACGIFRPHVPWFVPSEYFDRFPLDEIELPSVLENDLDDVPKIGRALALDRDEHEQIIKLGRWREAVRAYLANISFADDCVGRVLEALDSGPHRDNTIVVLWSDHGWHLGEKQHWRKFTLWENATRCVLAVVAPGVTSTNQTCDAPVSLIDVYPTLIELCGLSGNPRLEGSSFASLLRDPSVDDGRTALTTFRRGNHTVRTKNWRYIRYADGGQEVYDHQADPDEWHNLAAEPAHADKIKQWKAALPEHDAAEQPRK